MELSGLKLGTDIIIRDVEIWQGCFIKTYEVGAATASHSTGEDDEEVKEEKKPDLVIIHGYGSSGALWFKTYKEFANSFHCYFIDIIGMGASSREPFNCRTADETEAYMLKFVEAWRQEANLTNFFLAGHSFGGWLAGLYAATYP